MQLALNLPNPLAARQALFVSTGGQPFTTSRAVAERFGKHHKNVLRDIEAVCVDLADPEFSRLSFEPRDYKDSRGKNQPEYRMTRDGFVLLAMGFKGAPAMAWKVQFLKAFNALEAELAARTARYAAALDVVRPALRPVVEGTEQGLGRAAIAQPLGKTANAVTYHRNQARRLGLLHSA